MDVQSCLVVRVEGANYLGEPVGMLSAGFQGFMEYNFANLEFSIKSAPPTWIHLLQTVL